MSQESTSLLSRRTVFAAAGAAGALGATAVALRRADPPAAETAGKADAAAGADGRYQATPHVQRYYQTARV
jgi:hypothetical protein